jgi:hypothetical protein
MKTIRRAQKELNMRGFSAMKSMENRTYLTVHNRRSNERNEPSAKVYY